jgi:hypothetical protein
VTAEPPFEVTVPPEEALVLVIDVAVVVVTIGALIVVAVKVWVSVELSPLLVSVKVRVPAAEPTVKVAVARVLEVTVIVPRLAPEPPETVNNPLEVWFGSFQSVFVPVKVMEGVVPVFPEVGEIAKLGVLTVIVVLAESVVSVIVKVPVPVPVVNWQVPVVAVFVQPLKVTPETPEAVNVALGVSPLPAITRVIFVPLW